MAEDRGISCSGSSISGFGGNIWWIIIIIIIIFLIFPGFCGGGFI